LRREYWVQREKSSYSGIEWGRELVAARDEQMHVAFPLLARILRLRRAADLCKMVGLLRHNTTDVVEQRGITWLTRLVNG
jgi:hypothetical protein